MNVHAVQLDIVWENPKANFQRVNDLLASDAVKPGDLIVLPEIFADGFSMDGELLASHYDLVYAYCKNLAAEKKCHLIAGMVSPEKENLAIAFNPAGEELNRYHKMHAFSPGKEHLTYPPGDQVTTFKIDDWSVASSVCYDLRFPEIYRQAAGQGAELLVVIANWPAKRHGHWLALLKARAIENQSWVLGVNRCGSDPNLDYDGGSCLFDPVGDEIFNGSGSGEQLFSAALDRQQLLDWRQAFPALKDKRFI